MPMNKLSELKAAALAATPGPWVFVDDDWSDGDHANITSAERSDSSIIDIAQVNGGGTASDFDEPFRTEQQANTAFIASANPAVVLALLAELEEKDKRIADLEAGLLNSHHRLINTTQNCSEWERKAISNFEECATMSQRIEELQKRLATPVRLPEGLAQKIKVTGYYEALNEMMDCVRAAGFKCVGDEQ